MKSPEATPTPAVTRSPVANLLVAAAICLVLGFYAWTVASTNADLHLGGEKNDYYNQLLHGFRDGHLYMRAEVDPALLALPPEQRPGNAPFKLDASLYHEHYYLYFGVVPVVTLLWPFAVITGNDLPEAAAAAVFAAIGFGFAVWWWLDVRRRWFPRLSPWWVVLGVLCIGFCTAVPSTLRRPMFYEVAIAAGWAFAIIGIWALTRARFAEKRPLPWLAVAGISFGLAVGSRANLAPAALITLVIGTIMVTLSRHSGAMERRRALRAGLLVAGTGCAVIGLGLATYNYARFGSVTEFGHKYQFGLNPKQMFHASNFSHNLRLYYFTPPRLNGYFPFIAPADETAKPDDYVGREQVHGEWCWTLICGILLVGALGTWRQRAGTQPCWRDVLLLPVLWFAVNLLLTASTGIRANRYMLDFHPGLVLGSLSLLGLLATADRARGAIWWRGILAYAMMVACFFNVSASWLSQGFFQRNNPKAYEAMAQVADNFVAKWMPSRATPASDLILRVQWPKAADMHGVQALINAGGREFDDTLAVEWDARARARFVYFHGDSGDTHGEWFATAPQEAVVLRVSGAFLLPPVHHAAFGDLTPAVREQLKKHLRVSVDGQARFDRDVPSYDSSAGLQRFGALVPGDTRWNTFTGEVRQTETAPLSLSWAEQAAGERGSLRMKVELPTAREGLIEPLVQTGTSDGFDLLAIQYTRPGVVRFVHDQLGAGASWSNEIATNTGGQHVLEIELPGASDRFDRSEGLATGPAEKLRVAWDGIHVFDSPVPPRPVSAANMLIGMSEWSSVASRPLFGGSMAFPPRLEAMAETGPGTLDFDLNSDTELIGDVGLLARWDRPDGRAAALLWSRVPQQQAIRLGWAEGKTVFWAQRSVPAATKVQLRIPSDGPMHATAVDPHGWLEIYGGELLLLARPSEFFAAGPVGGVAIRPNLWHHENAAANVSDNALPGRVAIGFYLPTGDTFISHPLLSVGVAGAADSIFLRRTPDQRYVVGVDHWGYGGPESPAIELSPDDVHRVVIELGTLFEHAEVPPDRARIWIDGRLVLETRANFYAAKLDTVAIGQNPAGMSTSGPAFGGTLTSIQRHVPEPGSGKP